MDEEPGDRALLEAVANGDREAFRILYDRHSGWLLLRLRRRCQSDTLAEDAVQDTFVAVWRKPGAYKGTGDVGAWLWGIAVRRLIDLIRRRRAPVFAVSEIITSAEDQVLLGVEHGDLGGALSNLAPELRAVVQATVLDGLTTREASRLLGVPQGTVKTRMARARMELRGALA